MLAFLACLCIHAASQQDKPWKNGSLRVSDNSRFLQHKNGQPFFWMGETGWLMPQRLTREEIGFYIQKCSEEKYNVIQIQVLNDIPSFNVYGKASGTSDWKLDCKVTGEYGYWDHMDYIISTAEKHGIYIGMVCIWGRLIKSGKMTADDARTYGTFLANRYKDRPNIVWILGGDITGDIKPELWDTLATTIRSIDHRHLMTYHPQGRTTSAKWFNNRDWLDFNMFQSGHRRYNQRMDSPTYPIPDNTEEDNWQYVDSVWSYKPIKPVIDGEPSYEGIPKGLHDLSEPQWTAKEIRRYAYWSVFAGSCGHTYGNNAIMQMHKPGHQVSYGTEETVKYWYEGLKDPGFGQMKYIKHLMLSFPYFERFPDQTTIIGNGKRYHRLIATRGADYLMVYNYCSNSMNIDLSKISGKNKMLFWMNASDGKLTFLGKTSSGNYTFHHNAKTDGVLIAFDASKNYLKQSQKQIIR